MQGLQTVDRSFATGQRIAALAECPDAGSRSVAKPGPHPGPTSPTARPEKKQAPGPRQAGHWPRPLRLAPGVPSQLIAPLGCQPEPAAGLVIQHGCVPSACPTPLPCRCVPAQPLAVKIRPAECEQQPRHRWQAAALVSGAQAAPRSPPNPQTVLVPAGPAGFRPHPLPCLRR